MPFVPWMMATRDFNPAIWDSAVDVHEKWLPRLAELGVATVLGSGPVTLDGLRLNEAFAWQVESGYQATHHKYYLPEESDFWEAPWCARGDNDLPPVYVPLVKLESGAYFPY